jgi:hypothetical protein
LPFPFRESSYSSSHYPLTIFFLHSPCYSYIWRFVRTHQHPDQEGGTGRRRGSSDATEIQSSSAPPPRKRRKKILNPPQKISANKTCRKEKNKMYSPGHPASSASYDYEIGRLSQPVTHTETPKGKGHWQQVEPQPLPYVPELPENPTEQQRAERAAALAELSRVRFGNIAFDWIPDPEPEPKPKTKFPAIERGRPPKRPLPRRSSKPPKMNVRKHESHCSICRHPDREAIEEEFIHWFSPRATAEDYDIDVRAIYRHAHACNLFTVRNRKIRFVLSHSLERAEHAAPPTAGDLNRMVRTFTRLTDDGEWIEPPSHVIVSSGRQIPSSGAPVAAPPPPAAPEPEPILKSPPPAEPSPDSAPSAAPNSHLESNDLAPSISTRRAEKTSPHLIENNQNASAFLDTQNRPRNSAGKISKRASG